MRYEGQVEAAIELLEELETVRAPADKHMAYFFRKRRYMGSKDKGVVADFVYSIFRHRGEISYALKAARLPIQARPLVLAYLRLIKEESVAEIGEVFDGEHYHPSALTQEEKDVLEILPKHKPENLSDRLNFPGWLENSLIKAFGENLELEMEALNSRATSDIRVNSLKTDVKTLKENLAEQEIDMREGEYSSHLLRMDDRRSLFGFDEFKAGHFEMQDEGSQLIAAACHARPGQKVVDFCAGAGGKTLALAADMNNKGSIVACDIHERRLGEMPKRLRRAGVHNVQTKVIVSENDKWVKRQKGKIDTLLIDAPCSGTGTWRRSPDARWRLTQKTLDELKGIQYSILKSASRMVKEEGRLVYATCSVLKEENEDQVEKFLKEVPGFKLLPVEEWNPDVNFPKSQELGMLRLSPSLNKTDGFFMAVFVRKSVE